MSQQGLKSLFPIEDISVMGIWELLPHIYKFGVSSKIENLNLLPQIDFNLKFPIHNFSICSVILC